MATIAALALGESELRDDTCFGRLFSETKKRVSEKRLLTDAFRIANVRSERS
ncbi:hypothetical protein RRSWK_05089 [Rhodopirellula sp. SWK7]|nr:hypothetical protein RRSWK_05089 [Rhodopirellula sp. SWK7]